MKIQFFPTWLAPAHARCLIVLALVGSVAASGWYYTQSAARLQSAAHNLHTCRELAARITRLAKAPPRARLETWSQDDLGSVVEQAAANAQLARDRVLRIDPRSAKRLGKTDYLEQATEVELSAVTLRQVVEFLYEVTRGDDQLEVGTLRLRLPHEAASATSDELWLADIVLTQRIYAPTTAKR